MNDTLIVWWNTIPNLVIVYKVIFVTCFLCLSTLSVSNRSAPSKIHQNRVVFLKENIKQKNLLSFKIAQWQRGRKGKYPPVYSFYMSQFVGNPEACLIAISAADTDDEIIYICLLIKMSFLFIFLNH